MVVVALRGPRIRAPPNVIAVSQRLICMCECWFVTLCARKLVCSAPRLLHTRSISPALLSFSPTTAPQPRLLLTLSIVPSLRSFSPTASSPAQLFPPFSVSLLQLLLSLVCSSPAQFPLALFLRCPDVRCTGRVVVGELRSSDVSLRHRS
jgi:hypothetical protein